jgi:hypothetical protein
MAEAGAMMGAIFSHAADKSGLASFRDTELSALESGGQGGVEPPTPAFKVWR